MIKYVISRGFTGLPQTDENRHFVKMAYDKIIGHCYLMDVADYAMACHYETLNDALKSIEYYGIKNAKIFKVVSTLKPV